MIVEMNWFRSFPRRTPLLYPLNTTTLLSVCCNNDEYVGRTVVPTNRRTHLSPIAVHITSTPLLTLLGM